MRYIQDASLASQPPRRSQQPRAPLCLSLVTRRPLPSRPLSPPSAALAPSRSIAPPAFRPVILSAALLLAQVDKLGDVLACLELLVQPARRLSRIRRRPLTAPSVTPGSPPAYISTNISTQSQSHDLCALCHILPPEPR